MNIRAWKRLLHDTGAGKALFYPRRRRKAREVKIALMDLFSKNPNLRISVKGLCYKILGSATPEDQIIIENARSWINQHWSDLQLHSVNRIVFKFGKENSELSKRTFSDRCAVKQGYQETVNILIPQINEFADGDKIKENIEVAVSTTRASKRGQPLIV